MARTSGAADHLGLVYDEVIELSRKFGDWKTQIEDLITSVETAWTQTTWKGPDADNFEQSWDDNKGALKTLADNFGTAQTKAREQADAQKSTSAS